MALACLALRRSAMLYSPTVRWKVALSTFRNSRSVVERAPTALMASILPKMRKLSNKSQPPTLQTPLPTGADLQKEIEHANERYAGKIGIQSTKNHGWGVYALANFDAGTMLFSGNLLGENPVSDMQHSHTIQTGWKEHVIMDLPARYANHVCGPMANIGVKVPEGDIYFKNGGTSVYEFCAKRNIEKGEQLVWDYETTEYFFADHFACTCSSEKCRKVLIGFRDRGNEVVADHGREWVAPYLLEE